MMALKVVLIFMEVVCSVLMIGVILLQKTKGEGLGMAFGAEMGESLFGARAGNVLTKITVWLTVFFLVNTTVLARIYTHHRPGSLMDRSGAAAPIEQRMPAEPAAAPVQPAQAPGGLPSAPIGQPVQPSVPAPAVAN